MNNLTKEELDILMELKEVWRMYNRLPVVHPNDAHEFLHGVHALQNIILARLYSKEILVEGR